MSTIHIVMAEKQYSPSKVLAAFDDAVAASKFVETVNAVEPRYALSVQPIELQESPPKPFHVRTAKLTPVAEWTEMPADAEVTVYTKVAEPEAA